MAKKQQREPFFGFLFALKAKQNALGSSIDLTFTRNSKRRFTECVK